jgi:uncharacterized glyoxalase superfamily protein PhnB
MNRILKAVLALSLALVPRSAPNDLSLASNSITPQPGSSALARQEKTKPMNVKRLTPVLFVAEIEPCAKFWTERLGFQITAQVPESGKLGFVILQKGAVEVMYQSYASVEKDMPAIRSVVSKGPTFLYVEVDDLDAVIQAVKGAEYYMSERKTFYGSREIGVKDPAGHYVTFAQFAAAPPQN